MAVLKYVKVPYVSALLRVLGVDYTVKKPMCAAEIMGLFPPETRAQTADSTCLYTNAPQHRGRKITFSDEEAERMYRALVEYGLVCESIVNKYPLTKNIGPY